MDINGALADRQLASDVLGAGAVELDRPDLAANIAVGTEKDHLHEALDAGAIGLPCPSGSGACGAFFRQMNPLNPPWRRRLSELGSARIMITAREVAADSDIETLADACADARAMEPP